jgi:hypothetical protein
MKRKSLLHMSANEEKFFNSENLRAAAAMAEKITNM